MYADDTNLFISNKCPEKIFSLAQQELQDKANWLPANKLLLNTDKTKYRYILFNSVAYAGFFNGGGFSDITS